MAQEMYSELFKDTATTLVEIRALAETIKEAHELIGENGWEVDEGLRIIFANGISYLRGHKRVEGLEGLGGAAALEVKRLTTELMDAQSKYAVMKFRAYTLDQAKQALEFNIVALETENVWSGERLKMFRDDEELLRAELRTVKAEREELRQRVALLGAPPSVPARRGLLRTLLPLFGR